MDKKKILVICAQKEEFDGIFFEREKKIYQEDIYYLEEDNFIAYVATCGIGKTAIAYHLGRLLSVLKVDLIINTGVAGSLSKEVTPFDTFVSTRAAYYDVDVRAFGYQLGQMCGQPLYFEADPKALRAAINVAGDKIKTGLILSGDNFITGKNIPSYLYTDFENPCAIDMESAAVAQVANMAHIPFLIIRSISDDPNSESNNQDTYDNRLEDTCISAGRMTYHIIQEYSKR